MSIKIVFLFYINWFELLNMNKRLLQVKLIKGKNPLTAEKSFVDILWIACDLVDIFKLQM